MFSKYTQLLMCSLLFVGIGYAKPLSDLAKNKIAEAREQAIINLQNDPEFIVIQKSLKAETIKCHKWLCEKDIAFKALIESDSTPAWKIKNKFNTLRIFYNHDEQFEALAKKKYKVYQAYEKYLRDNDKGLREALKSK
ncbi:MAG: hypothetical protein HQL32_17950 [Planctomycetes bacterium]|nr:hypothetical protein [Planctomycetota bacterium]